MTNAQPWPAAATEMRPIEAVTPFANNARVHSDEQVQQIVRSMQEFGWTIPCLIDEEGVLIAGHGRLMAAIELGFTEVPCMVAKGWSEEQKRAYLLADNRLTEASSWDKDALSTEISFLQGSSFDVSLTGFSNTEITGIMGLTPEEPPKGNLADDFGVPPFSVLNGREGWWQDRKRAWLGLGIQSELGREDMGTTVVATDWMKRGKDEGGSIFDPVLAELAYTWFSPKGGKVLDPFAGGSVRGVVAAQLGRKYVGIELRGEQVKANRAQGKKICKRNAQPKWIEGDSTDAAKLLDKAWKADFLFSCPPYADLEVYSDDARDISTMGYKDFLKAYRAIIAEACKKLAANRFACFVVGDVRDKKGNYQNFVGDTVQAFEAAGLHLYNEAVFVTPVGSLPIRAGRQFSSGRKLGKTHQNILVFVKGDGKKAADACGTVDVAMPPAEEEADPTGGFELG